VNGDGEAGCDPILSNNKQLEHVSQADRDKAKAAADLLVETSSMKQKESDFIRMAGDLCQAGNFQRLGEELEKQRGWFGDLSSILATLGKAKSKSLETALQKAKDPEGLKAAFDSLIADPSADPEKTQEVYLTRRSEMFRSAIEDRGQSVDSLQTVISQYEMDLTDVGADGKKVKQGISWAHTSLGDRLRDDKDLSGAERQYEKALRFADIDGKVKIQQEMAKMFLSAAEDCLKENKAKPAKCDALAKRARKHMDGAISAQGRKRGEEEAEVLAGMKMEKIQTFGLVGSTAKVSGYGIFNPYGGSYDKLKYQTYQTGMQEAYMQRMLQWQMGGAGLQGAGGSGGSFFR
jgi:hypothetical protein